MGEPDRKYGLQNVLCIASIGRFDANEHNALSDAYNTALIFADLKHGALKLNEHYIKANEAGTVEKQQTFGCTLGELFQEMMAGVA